MDTNVQPNEGFLIRIRNYFRRPIATTWAEPRNNSNEAVNEVEALKCSWPHFIIFRFLGLWPILRRGNELRAPPRLRSLLWLPTILLLLFQVMLFCNTFLKVRNVFEFEYSGSASVGTVMYLATYLICYSQVFCNVIFVTWKIHDFPNFISACKSVESLCERFQTTPFSGMVRNCLVVFATVEIAHLASTILFYVSFAFDYRVSSLGNYFQHFNNYLWHSGSYYSGALLCLAEIYTMLGWNFGNVLLNSLAMILNRYFIQINQILAIREPEIAAEVEELRQARGETCRLVWQCNEIFGPLFLVTYICNFMYVFPRLYVTLVFDLHAPDYIVRVESIFSISHLIIFKLLVPSYLGARLHETAYAGLDTVRRWRSSVNEYRYRYHLIEHFKTQFTIPVGISGCGYFLLTKGFILTLLGYIITFSVVILQIHQQAS